MAKKEKKGSKTKKSVKAIVMSALLPIIVVMLIAGFILAIFEAIIGFIIDIVVGIFDATFDFLAHPIKGTIKALASIQNKLSEWFNGGFNPQEVLALARPQTVIISLEDFEAMKSNFDTSIDRETIGLDDNMLKKMLLAYNASLYSKDATIMLELNGEIAEGEEKSELDMYKSDSSLTNPFVIKTGKQVLGENFFNDIGSAISEAISSGNETKKAEYEKINDMRETSYLCTNGILEFKCTKSSIVGTEYEEKMNYLPPDVLDELYQKYEEKKNNLSNSNFANSIWEFLGTCYTDDDTTNCGIKMYSRETVQEEIRQFQFNDDELIDGMSITKTLFSNVNKTRGSQTIDIQKLVGEYATPLEFMISLLEISSSKEFVEAFIDKVANDTTITLKAYKTGKTESRMTKEEMKESTNITGEIKMTAEIIGLGIWEHDEEEDSWTARYHTNLDENWPGLGVLRDYINNKLNIRLDLEEKNTGGFWKDIKIKRKVAVSFKNSIPRYTAKQLDEKQEETYDIISAVRIRLYDGEGNYKTVDLWEEQYEDGDPDYFYYYEDEESSWIPKYATRSNPCIVQERNTHVTTESKIDMAVAEVNTWYATMSFDNQLVTDIGYHTENSEGKLINKTNDVEKILKDAEGTDNYVTTQLERHMIENSKTKPTENYYRNHGGEDYNPDIIFSESPDIWGIKISQLGNVMESWFKGLSAHDAFYTLTGGPISRWVYDAFAEKDENGNYTNVKFETMDDAVHVKLIYALEEGITDAWFKEHYTPVEVESVYTEGTEGMLITTVDTYLRDPLTNSPTERYDFFLSLLKNEHGYYYKTYDYKSDGKEVTYEDVYGDEIRVARLLLNGEDMLYQLLEKSQNTQGLTEVMRAILHKYKTDASISIEDLLDMEPAIEQDLTVLGKDYQEKIWITLIRSGFSQKQAASILGNIVIDAGDNENEIKKMNKTEVGLCKWSGNRKDALIYYAKSKGLENADSQIDINTQVEYLIAELTEGGKGFVKYQPDNVMYSDGTTYYVDDWKSGTNLNTLTETFAHIFKKPKSKLTDLDERKEKAAEYYELYKDIDIYEDLLAANSDQEEIVECAKNYSDYGIVPENKMCLKWVKQVYQQVTGEYAASDCALCSGHLYGVSTDFSIIPIGAAVYGESETSPKYGHVGIYIGDGEVMHNIGGRIETSSLDEWILEYPNGCWGWVSSTEVNSAYPITKGLVHSGRH